MEFRLHLKFLKSDRHDGRLRKIILNTRESRLKLNQSNYKIRKKISHFLGHAISSEGINVQNILRKLK